ncbi:MAG: hypothetical protein JKY65_18310 [Planctomycetes bacterium]|nr:hypothetical protein [Planctomycetota bacterium]
MDGQIPSKSADASRRKQEAAERALPAHVRAQREAGLVARRARLRAALTAQRAAR